MSNDRQQLRIHLERECRKLADILKPHVRESTGFTLLLYDMGEDGNISYVSTADRGDMMATFRELLDNLATDADPEGMVGKHERSMAVVEAARAVGHQNECPAIKRLQADRCTMAARGPCICWRKPLQEALAQVQP